MTPLRRLALGLACAALALPAAAQGLRATPQLGGAPVAPVRATESGPRPADYIVAVVNSEPITNNEVRTRMLRFEQQMAAQGASLPPRPVLIREVLERLISERAQLILARENGVKVDDSQVDLAEANIARGNQFSVAELRRRLTADGVNVAQFREDLRNQLLLQRLRDRELAREGRVSELEIDNYLRDQESGGASAPTEINLAHLLVAVPENATPQQVATLQAKAQSLQQRAKAGEDFAKLARENSDASGARETGGVIGPRTPDRLPPIFVEATRNVAQGGVSEPVRSAAGFHILKVLERRQATVAGMTITQTHSRHILLRPGPNLSETQAVQKLADFKRRVQARQADFAELARDNSQDASARNGGDLGWTSPGMFVPEFEDVMNALAPGELSDPVTSRFGVHLIQVLERRQSTLSQREQREVARNLLREKKLDEAYAQWAQDVRGRAYVEYRDPPQ